MTLGIYGAAPGSRDKAVVHTGDLMISVPNGHLKWMPRLTGSRKLSQATNERNGFVPFLFFCTFYRRKKSDQGAEKPEKRTTEE